MNPKFKNFLFFFIGAFMAIVLMYFFNTYKIEKKTQNPAAAESSSIRISPKENKGNITEAIDVLTEENRVIQYVKANKRLPDYYLTKNEARKQGWIASEGNLCDVLPGRAIGGDHFSNREKKLPKGAAYFEADVNYSCGRRNADRIIFTKNGDVWLTKNHYKTFEKQ